MVREGTAKMGWFDMSTLKEPYRLEGKKTMGLELAEQTDYRLPDVILYPTGGGTGLIGMWKAFQELTTLGWLRANRLPRMVSCQSDGCAPIVTAFQAGTRFAELFPNAHTCASGLRVPAAVGDFMMLDAIRASGGCALSRTGDADQRLAEARHESGRHQFLSGDGDLPRLSANAGANRARSSRMRKSSSSTPLACRSIPETVRLDLPRLDKDGPVDLPG